MTLHNPAGRPCTDPAQPCSDPAATLRTILSVSDGGVSTCGNVGNGDPAGLATLQTLATLRGAR